MGASVFGLVRRAGAFAVVLPTFVLVSRIQISEQYRCNDHFLSAVSSSRCETIVVDALVRALSLSVDLGVGGAAVPSGSRDHPSHSCDGLVCDLGVVGVSLIFGFIRGDETYAGVLPTFVLVPRM